MTGLPRHCDPRPEQNASNSPKVVIVDGAQGGMTANLWADGEEGRKTDDLVWKPEDLAGDGTHPSPSGQRRVADLLLRFMKTDPTAKTWFSASNP